MMIRLHVTANYLKLLTTNLLTCDYNTKLLHSQLHFSEQENQPLGKTYLITNQQPSKHQEQKSASGCPPSSFGLLNRGIGWAAPLPDGGGQVNDILSRHLHVLVEDGKSQGMFASPALE